MPARSLPALRGLLAVALVAAASCADSIFPSGNAKSFLTVQVNLTSAAVAGVSVEVTGPGITVPTVVNLPIANGVASGTVEVLAGSQRVVTIRAFDEQGVETHRGSTTIQVREGTNPTLSLVLEPLTGDVPLTATIGSYLLTLSPALDSINVAATRQYTATVTNGQGVPVANPALVWGSSNPAFATVNASGLATAHYPGTATIVVNFQGFAASATLVVR